MLLKRERRDQSGEVDHAWRILTRSCKGREGRGVVWEVRRRLPGRVLGSC
jgi:hypothetical protein